MSYTGRVSAPAVNPQMVENAVDSVATITIGTIMGIVAITTGVVKLINSAQKTIRVFGVGNSLSSVEMKLNSSMDSLRNEMDRLTSDNNARYELAVRDMNNMLNEAPDITSFCQSLKTSHENLQRELAEGRNAIQEKYINEINRELSIGQTILRQTKADIDSSISRITSDMEKQDAAKPYAEKIIAEVELKIDGFRQSFNDSITANNKINELINILEKAKAYYSAGNYTMALEEAYIANDAIFLRLKDMLELEIRQKHIYADAKALHAVCKELLDKSAKATCDNEFITESGTVEDFSRFFRGDYEKFEAQLSKIENELSADFRDISEARIIEIQAELAEWQLGFVRSAVLAHERMENLAFRYDAIQMMVKDFAEAGYTFEAVDDTNELDQMIIYLKNSDGKRLDVKYSAVLKNGHVDMVVDIDDHADYEGSDNEIEEKRSGVRNKICQTLNKQTNGRMAYRQVCSNPGVTKRS